MRISAVIPTRNRPKSLIRLLQSIHQQTFKLREVIIVDSSNDASYHQSLKKSFPDISLELLLTTTRSVCYQRNLGIQNAKNEWILLCDDDIELPNDYVEKLTGYITQHPTSGAVAGRLLQTEGSLWVDRYSVKNILDLLWRFVFQLSIWGDVDQLKPPSIFKPLYSRIVSFYQKRGNTSTLAGWPLITQWKETFTSSFYSLGANLIKREWLLKSRYDEVLDSNGIGDNYGVALGFPGKIHVLSSTFAHHHSEITNRLPSAVSYYRRILALHYFIVTSKKYSASTVRWLLWSVFGNCLKFFVTLRWWQAYASAKAIALILFNRNPYQMGSKKKLKIVKPQVIFSTPE